MHERKRSYPLLSYGWIAGICCCLSFTSCDIINPDEPQPAYLYIAPFEVEVNESTQGVAADNITEVWVSINGDFAGAFPVPSTIPVLQRGSTAIRLEAGIRDNGISNTPEIYPFYTPFTATLNLVAGQTDTLRPVIQYREAADFIFVERFENSGHLFREVLVGDPVSNRVSRDNIDPFEGDFSGFLALDQSQAEVIIGSTRRFPFPDFGSAFPTVYLEVNYKSEGLVGFGLLGYGADTGPQGTFVFSAGFRPREEWNKIYFNLSQIFADQDFFEYQLIFQAAIPQEDGTYIKENARIWLDNMKLIRF